MLMGPGVQMQSLELLHQVPGPMWDEADTVKGRIKEGENETGSSITALSC